MSDEPKLVYFTGEKAPRCSECHWLDKVNPSQQPHAQHSPKCSRASVHDLRLAWASAEKDRLHQYESTRHARNYAALWEGKFRVLCHENNKLRKKLEAFAQCAKEQTPPVTLAQQIAELGGSPAFCAVNKLSDQTPPTP